MEEDSWDFCKVNCIFFFTHILPHSHEILILLKTYNCVCVILPRDECDVVKTNTVEWIFNKTFRFLRMLFFFTISNLNNAVSLRFTTRFNRLNISYVNFCRPATFQTYDTFSFQKRIMNFRHFLFSVLRHLRSRNPVWYNSVT